ncbi:phage tail protein, partial [Bisgaard Taxon 45]
MNIFYKDGFYVDEQKIPANAVEITEQRYIELLNGQSDGKIIVSDKSGNPILIDPAPSSFHELKNGEWKITKAKQKEQLNAEKTRLILFTANKVDEMKSAL